MPFAARVGDSTAHPGTITGPGVATVLIENMPAAVLGDSHACTLPPPAHIPASVIVNGSSSVLIGGRPAARMSDAAGCGSMIVAGATKTVIGG